MKKLFYSAPVTEILSLVSIQETMQSGSAQTAKTGTSTGEAITWDEESDVW